MPISRRKFRRGSKSQRDGVRQYKSDSRKMLKISEMLYLYHIFSSDIIWYHHICSYIFLYHLISSYIILYHLICSYIFLYHLMSSYMILYILISTCKCFLDLKAGCWICAIRPLNAFEVVAILLRDQIHSHALETEPAPRGLQRVSQSLKRITIGITVSPYQAFILGDKRIPINSL